MFVHFFSICQHKFWIGLNERRLLKWSLEENEKWGLLKPRYLNKTINFIEWTSAQNYWRQLENFTTRRWRTLWMHFNWSNQSSKRNQRKNTWIWKRTKWKIRVSSRKKDWHKSISRWFSSTKNVSYYKP